MRYLILLCLAWPISSVAETSLWKISKGTSSLYLGGTIHVLSEDDYPLPVEFEQAYNQAETIVFETDLAAMAQLDVQTNLIHRLTYSEGQSLKDYLRDETYQALAKYATSRGLSIESFNPLKPPLVIITLLMTELQRHGMANTGVDKYFNAKAIADGKTLSTLESLQKQIDVIEHMGKGHEDEMIMSTLEELKELPVVMADMKAAWRKGDSKTLEKIGISQMKVDYPELYNLLLVQRNNAWVPRIEAFLATPEVEFVLVGALHLVANEGLISRLRELGYKVELF